MKNIKQKMKIVAVFLLIITGVSTLYAQELGANFNENIDKANPVLISDLNAKWYRGFVNVPSQCLNISSDGTVTGVDNTSIENLSGINSLIASKGVTVHNMPTKLIFSLKMAFTTKNMGVPSVGTSEMGYVMQSIVKLLTHKNFGAYIDVLAVGNEPMWETPTEDADKYEAFLNLLIDKVDSLRLANHWNYEIYAGAINKANSNKTHAILLKVLKIAAENPKVVGLDVHEHVTQLSEAENDIKYIRNTLKFSKKMMCTEFSLVWLWNAHISDTLGNWGNTNGYSSSLKMYEWLNVLMQKSYTGTPVTPEHFYSYFASTSWYPKNWFQTFYNIFRKYSFSQATYGAQNLPINKALTTTSDLWTVNFICNGTYLGLDANNLGNKNPLVYPTYKHITDSLYSIPSGTKDKKMPTVAYHISHNQGKSILNIDGIAPENRLEIDIYNLKAQRVYSQLVASMPTSINLYEYGITKGMYLLSINDRKMNVFNHKIIIK